MTDKLTLFMVRGTGARALQQMNGSLLGNFDQMVGAQLGPNDWDVVDVAYPGDQLSLEAFLNMGYTSSIGVEELTKKINDLPVGRKFAMIGMSQGAIVVSKVYEQIVAGSLSSRNDDLIAGIAFGNPRRKAGHSIPGGVAPGGNDSRGILASDLMQTVDSRWWDFVNTNDMAADNRYLTPIGMSAERIFQTMYGNYFGEGSFLDFIVDEINKNVFSAFGVTVGEVLSTTQALMGLGGLFLGSLQLIFLTDPSLTNDPHLSYHRPYTNLPGNTKSAVQLAVDRLNSLIPPGRPAAALAAARAVEDRAQYIRDRYKSIRQAKPIIRLWMNDPDWSKAGAKYIGRIDLDDTIRGSFPFKNNTPSQGIIELRDDHYISMFLKKLPNDPELRKNVIITVDFYNGAKRWSGLLDTWEVKTRDGAKYLEVTFQDDLTFLQYLLCPPNPALPIPVFQFPRIFTLAGPSRWCVAMIIFINLIRTQAFDNWLLPDDPFDFDSWMQAFESLDDLWDWSDWQTHVTSVPFLEDNSLWTFLASRMNPVDSVVSNTLDDAALSIRYRRVITDDGEFCQPNVFVPNNVKNCALVFEVVDNSNITSLEGTFYEGTIVDGFVRSIVQYGSGFIEDVLNVVTEDQTLAPDEYYQNGYWGTVAKMPWVVLRDNEWSPIESSSLSWGPSKNVSVVVGGDNPAADAIAKLVIETIGNLLGALIMFSSIGTIISEVIMPFLSGTIAAWLYWRNQGRQKDLGWIHYLESYQTGAESNSWSLSSIAALRGGFLSGRAETRHVMALHDSWMIPGIHADVGHRIGSNIQSKGLEENIWVNQIEEMVAQWENSAGSQQPYAWLIKAGKSERSLTLGERLARLTKKVTVTANNIGFSIIQA